MKEEKWKTLIRQKLQDYEETPPPELWNDLMKALPQPEQQRPATVHTRRRWLYGIETALGAAAALTALFWVFRYPTTVPPRASHTVVEHKQPLESPTHPHAQTADFRNKDTEKRLIAFSVNTPSQAAATTAVAPAPASAPEREKADSTAPENTDRKIRPQVRSAATRSKTASYAAVRTDGYSRRTSPKRWEVGAYAGGNNFNAAQGEESGNFLMATSIPDKLPANESTSSTPLYQPNRALDTRTHHKFPIHAGLSVRYRLTGRWALESGLFYSYLASDIVSGSTQQQYDVSQKLQYLGIPLGISYTLLDSRHWNLYTSAGAAAEICVSGRTDSRYVVNGETLSGERQDVRIKQPQWSVNATLGAQFNLTDHTAIYAEPGISYYFDNHSRLSTYYQDHPLNFNLKFGLRFSIR